MSAVFGPVPSRRLGLSLGVDPLPFKTCNMDCVYCELGRTKTLTAERKVFIPVEEVLADVREALKAWPRLDHVTVTGSGEPTLHTGLGDIIRGIKAMTDIPVAAITHSSLLHLPDVRADLCAADVLVPSLDAVTSNVFRSLNHPHASIDPARMVEGLIALHREFSGQFWLEIVFVRGMNDTPEEVSALKKAIHRIGPDRVQLNTVVRPPAYPSALALTQEELEAIRDALGPPAEVIAEFPDVPPSEPPEDPEESIAAYLDRRPATVADLLAAFGVEREKTQRFLESLVGEGDVERLGEGEKAYYRKVRKAVAR
ncbi:MAG: radical SAM protein [Nitrospinota bacterium]